jgi:hypothetical protein
MSNITFVSHEFFPDDPYVKELVYLCIDDKYRIAYVRKQAKNGGLFWSIPSISAAKDGVKTYFESVILESRFLEKDIEKYLESQPWKTGFSPAAPSVFSRQSEELPF